MSQEFEIVFDGEFAATPEQLWQAVTAETAAWLFPTEGMGGEELIWERPTHHLNRLEGPDGWFNQLEQIIEERPGGRSYLRWVHSGVFQDDWDAQYDAASQHTAFYLHTLAQYLEHFAGRPVVFADIQAPEASNAPEAFELLRSALGINATTAVGDPTTAQLPGIPAGAIVDLQNEHFIGLRTDDALYRFFGRNAFGGRVGMTVHHFGGADPDLIQRQWQEWIDDVFA